MKKNVTDILDIHTHKQEIDSQGKSIINYPPILWLDPSAVRLVSYFGIWFSLLVPHSIDIAPAKHRTTYVMIVLAALFLRLLISQSNYAFFWQDIPMPSVYL